MRRLRDLVPALGWLALVVLLTPLFWAVWVSFTPDELLRPPVTRWSLRWYTRFLQDPRWTTALVNSLIVGLGSALVALAAGAPAALAVSRHAFRGRAALGRLILLPICVPPVVLGMGLLPTMHALGLWGGILSLVLAHGLLGMPLVFLAVQASLDGMPGDLEEAARGLGAGPLAVAWRVTLPLCRPGLMAGWVLSFVLSLNEFFLALFLATPETETLPRVIWPELRYSLSPLVAVASVLTLTLTASACLFVAGLSARRPRGERRQC
jgi:ABC-type spermidine/putrescine transport system permease subunit II